MDTQQRQRMLAALGLTDWQPRPDGALAHRLDRTPATLETGQPAPMAAPNAPLQHRSDAGPEAVADAASDVSSTKPTIETSMGDDETSSGDARPVSEMDWAALESWLATRDHRGAQRPVFGVGARDADVLIVGEAPGASEDAQGVPFVGRAGKLLDRMLFAIGCSRDTNVYITNICKFRPPNNRDPNPDEVAADWPVLERQIELMDPKLVVAVGRVAAQTLLDSKDSLGRMRGRLHKYPRRELDVLVTYHPAFLLRSPGMKAKAWDDLKRIARAIGHRAVDTQGTRRNKTS